MWRVSDIEKQFNQEPSKLQVAMDFLLHFSVSIQNIPLSAQQKDTQVLHRMLNRQLLTLEEVIKVTSVLQMEKLRPREVTWLARAPR